MFLICGAGPTGLTLAIQCARRNIPFRIIEKELQRSPYSRALVVWSACLESFRAMGITLHGIQPSSITISDRHRTLAHFAPETPALFLPQGTLEEVLENHLKTLGHSVERGTELLSFRQDTKVVAQTSKGEIVADWIAGCDGIHSAVRRTLGTLFEGYEEPFMIGLADCEVTGRSLEPGIHISWGAKGSVAFLPVTEKIWRIISTHYTSPLTLEVLQKTVDECGPGNCRLVNPTWISEFHIHERLAARFQTGRAFLLGDAAHVHSPAGGQGMNTGIQDAVNLGWKIPYLHSPDVLQSYEQERRPIAAKVIAQAAQRVQFAARQNPLMRLLKNVIALTLPRLRYFRQLFARSLSGLYLHYDNSRLILNCGEHIHGQYPLGPDHTLIFFGEKPNLSFGDLPLKVIHVPEGNGWCLVRPDRYIAARGTASCLPLVHEYFHRLLR